jgi:hypothetical protein
MKKYTIKEFADKIRSKYPNAYNDLGDDELVELWIKKHPDDKDFIITKGSHGFFFKLIILLMLLGGVYLAFYNNSPSNNNSDYSTDEILVEEIEQNITNDFLSTTSITENAIAIYNKSPFLQEINATENQTKWILAILSDPNPDLYEQEGDWCDQTDFICDYCSSYIPAKSYTLKHIMELISIESYALYKPGEFTKFNIAAKLKKETKYSEEDWYISSTNEIIQEGYSIVLEIIEKYQKGERYSCIIQSVKSQNRNYCSNKCQNESIY